jgi:hypothetical protein
LQAASGEDIVMGQIPLSQSIQVQNLAMSSFSNVDLCEKMDLDMEAKIKWQLRLRTSSCKNIGIFGG